jgi:hypothetical protein
VFVVDGEGKVSGGGLLRLRVRVGAGVGGGAQ